MKHLATIMICAFCALAQVAVAQSAHDVFARPWTEMTGQERAVFIAVTQVERGLGVKATNLRVDHQPVPWNPGARLVRMSGGWEPRNLYLYFLVGREGDIFRLDGSIDAIRKLNARQPLTLTTATIADFVWFNGFFVRGPEGPFLVAETAQDTFVPRLESTSGDIAPGYESLDQIPTALTCGPGTDGALFVCDGTVYYSNALFLVRWSIAADGEITIPQSRPVANKLNALINAPIDPLTTPGFAPLP